MRVPQPPVQPTEPVYIPAIPHPEAMITEHDLRAVNKVVELYVAEVPNPHPLLSNVPPDAMYFTVIDLRSAFFSVLLSERSRHLFVLQYRGQSYTYSHVPQGFKHSPHIFNKVLKEDLSDLHNTVQSMILQ